MKLNKFARDWYNHNMDSWKPSTQANYRNLIELQIIPHLGELELTEITAWSVEGMLKSLKGSICAARANKAACLVRIILNAAIGEGHLKENLSLRAKLLKEKAPEKRSWDYEDMRKIAANLSDGMFPFFLTQMYTGMRSGELAALRWKDIDFRNGTISISKSRSKFGEDTPKTAAGIRTIPMHEEVRKVLRNLIVGRAKSNVAFKDDYVFLSSRGNPIDCNNISQAWKNACVKAGIEPRRSYEIRHSFASKLVGAGKLSEASRLLGHANISTTINAYANTKGIKIEQVSAALNEVFA